MEKLEYVPEKDTFAESMGVDAERSNIILDIAEAKVQKIMEDATDDAEALTKLLNDVDEIMPDGGLTFREAIVLSYKTGQMVGQMYASESEERISSMLKMVSNSGREWIAGNVRRSKRSLKMVMLDV